MGQPHGRLDARARRTRNGLTRRGVLLGSCDSLRVFEAVGKANAILGTLVTLLNAPSFQSVCGAKAAAAGTASASVDPAAGRSAGRSDPARAS